MVLAADVALPVASVRQDLACITRASGLQHRVRHLHQEVVLCHERYAVD